ncbi:MAG TPA: hypothetical protein VMC84_09080 [Methanocella sp.]|uniref:hypothetical protein n=1 Tax=Methanocella sp. TaxID=2052833 RepID=UPI002C786579|nr:hypothetical protein [Methanocella sp.]HTY91315.1 hypothetical protein [Methanocella sp.]
MDRRRALALIVAMIIAAFIAAPAYASFLGTGVTFDKDFSNSVNVNVGKIAGLGDTAFGGADMNVGVSWDIPVDLTVVAGYPYGYGGVGVVTTGTTGYALGLTMDEAHGAGFNGADFGIPLSEQGITKTHFSKLWAAQNQIDNTQAFLPYSCFSGFPAI